MDWPVIGSLTAVAVLAGVVGVGSYAALRSDDQALPRRPSVPALLTAQQQRHHEQQQPQQQAYQRRPYQGRALTMPHLSVQDAEIDVAIRTDVLPVEPAPRVRLSPLPLERPQDEDDKEPATASLPRKRDDKPERPSAVAMPEPKKPKDERKAEVHDRRVMTVTKIVVLRRTLRLEPDQVAHWRPVEVILREIGREQMAQVRRGAKPEVGTGVMMRLYYAAQPLLGTLRPDQKERIRAMARSLGYGHVASML